MLVRVGGVIALISIDEKTWETVVMVDLSIMKEGIKGVEGDTGRRKRERCECDVVARGKPSSHGSLCEVTGVWGEVCSPRLWYMARGFETP